MPTAVGDEYGKVNGLPLSTPAWRHLDLSDIYASGPVGGGNGEIAYHYGSRPSRRWPRPKRIELPLIVDGLQDSDGNAYNDHKTGLRTNIEDLTREIRSRLNGDGTFLFEYIMPDGTIREARAQYNGRLGIDPVLPSSGGATVTVDLLLPGGILRDQLATSTSKSVSSSWNSPGTEPQGIAWDGGNSSLWLADASDDTIYEIDPANGSTKSSFAAPGPASRGVAFAGGLTDPLWVADSSDDTIYQVGLLGTVVSSFASPGPSPRGLTYDGADLWHVDSSDLIIYKLDTNGNILDQFDISDIDLDPHGLHYEATNALWMVGRESNINKLYRIDTADASVIETIALPGSPSDSTGLTSDGTDFWGPNATDDTLYRVGTVTIPNTGTAVQFALEVILSGTATITNIGEQEPYHSELRASTDLNNGDVTINTEDFTATQGKTRTKVHGNITDIGHERWLPVPPGGITWSIAAENGSVTVDVNQHMPWA